MAGEYGSRGTCISDYTIAALLIISSELFCGDRDKVIYLSTTQICMQYHP